MSSVKVGEKVKILVCYPCDALAGLSVGDVHKVTRLDKNGRGLYIEAKSGLDWYMNPDQVSPYLGLKDFSGFKVGDKVERVRCKHLGMRPGDIATVTGVSAAVVYLDSWQGGHDKDSLRVIERPSQATPPAPEPPQLNPGARLPSSLPAGSAERKEYPLYSVLFGYFPAAMNSLAHHAFKSNDKHNPGKPLQWSRNNSDDHAECLLRHLQEGDYEGVMWRAAALLQLQKEKEGAPVAPLATFD